MSCISPSLSYFSQYGTLQVHPCCCKWHYFVLFSWLISHSIYVPYLFYPFLCWWIFRLFSCPGYWKLCFSEHWGACIFLYYGFPTTPFEVDNFKQKKKKVNLWSRLCQGNLIWATFIWEVWLLPVIEQHDCQVAFNAYQKLVSGLWYHNIQ